MPREPGPERPDISPPPHDPARDAARDATPDDRVKLVRQALERLYDFPALERHPLAHLPDPDPARPALAGQGLRRALLTAIEALSPGPGTPVHAPDARSFNALHLHYVEGLTVEETARELGLSVRQVYRELRTGEERVSAYLAAHYGPAEPGPEAPPAAPPPVDAPRLAEHPRAVDLAALIERGQRVVERLAAQRGVQVALVHTATRVTLRCDPLLAHQALVSVLTAALQRAAPGPLRVTLAASGDEPAFTCTYRLLPGSSALPGLGQAAAQLLGQLGWQVGWTGQPDGGEALTVALPAYRATLLVIDDDEGLAQLLDRYLTGLELRVVAADNGPAGLALARELAPDAIVLDVMMPDVDGWEVLQTLRTQPETRETPVVVCSVFNDPDLAYALGASRFLPKPVNREALLRVLEETGVV
jgi:CheY-like chemotaxis protein/DNA-directed RNA polymerase specialized sigma24 family protein